MHIPRLARRPVAVLVAAAVGVAAAIAGPALLSAAQADTMWSGTAADGASVVAEHWVDARTIDITVSSPDARTDVRVELLLPPGWSPTAGRTWSVLYLLHGCCDSFQGWTQNTDVAQVTQSAQVIVAMPDGGPAGTYTNWLKHDGGGAAWEDFTATELPQILASGFRASGRQAIAGVSTGGGAALFIAADHRGAYTAAASYSGTDCVLAPTTVSLIRSVVLLQGADPNDMWGNPLRDAKVWRQHDACSLASSLRGTRLFLSVGSGLTSTGSATVCTLPTDRILESAASLSTYPLATQLTYDGIPHTTDFYTGGCHAWSYWQAAFTNSWPMLAAALGA